MTQILAIRLSALGDVIHTIPAVTALKSAGEVAWIVEAPYAELVEIVAAVRAIPVRLKRWSARQIGAARRAVRGFDVAVDFQGNIKSALVARASSAPVRYGFDRNAVREKPATLFYNRHVEVDRRQHVVEWNLKLAQEITDNRQPTTDNWLAFPSDPQHRLTRYHDRAILLPAAGRSNKQWPIDRFREIARPTNALVVWGPGEKHLAEAIGAEIAPETNLRELAFLLRHARVVVGGDTGPLHLAAALGTPVVGLYGPTDPLRNGPYGQLDSTISSYPTTRSMESISAEEVMAKVEEVLG